MSTLAIVLIAVAGTVIVVAALAFVWGLLRAAAIGDRERDRRR